MTSVPNDYDVDPARWASLDRGTQLAGDVHAPVPALITERCRGMVLDVGGGDGELARHLPAGWAVLRLDVVEAQRCGAHRRVPADHLRRRGRRGRRAGRVDGVRLVDVERWDAPMIVFKDRAAVQRCCIHQILDPAIVDHVSTPITLTKRGCLVVAVKPGG